MPTVGLHALHYAHSPFYCTVRIGSRTVESARVSRLLTECGPCSPARSPGTVARNPTLQRRRPFSFECRRSDVEYTLRVANPDGMPKGSCTLAAPPEAGAVYACRPRQSAEGSRNRASSPAPSATSRHYSRIASCPHPLVVVWSPLCPLVARRPRVSHVKSHVAPRLVRR